MSAGKRMGRPPLAEGKARAVVFTLRLTPEERAEIAAAAKREDAAATQWAREILLSAARSPWRLKTD